MLYTVNGIFASYLLFFHILFHILACPVGSHFLESPGKYPKTFMFHIWAAINEILILHKKYSPVNTFENVVTELIVMKNGTPFHEIDKTCKTIYVLYGR